MSNLDKLRAKNKAAQEMKAQNQAKKSENLVDDIIQSGVSYEEASNDEAKKETVTAEDITENTENVKKEENVKKVPATESSKQPINEGQGKDVSIEEKDAVETPLNASEGKMTKKPSREAVKSKKSTKGAEEQQTIKAAISLVASRRENKSVRKSFLIKESSNEKLKILADQLGTSENDVINQILESVLSDVE
ncbi:MAG: hypothetical protein MSA91_13380 [Lachnobacterium sp.]|nr:hypothetical protein [Lachnobacterium sp.]